MLSLRGKIILKLTFIKSNIRDWFAQYYLDFTSAKYANIQYLTTKYKPGLYCITFRRRYLFGRWWTPIMAQINPATIPIKRPTKLGIRWGGDAWHKNQH